MTMFPLFSVSVSATVLRYGHLRRARGPGSPGGGCWLPGNERWAGATGQGSRCQDNQSRVCLQMLRGWFVQRPVWWCLPGSVSSPQWMMPRIMLDWWTMPALWFLSNCPVAGEKHGPRPRVCVMPGSLSTTLHHHNSNIVYNRRNKTGWQYNV